MKPFRPNGLPLVSPVWLKALFCGLALLAATLSVRANQPIPTDSPLGFFTNVAARVLATGLNVNLNRIQVYPTNQYTPAVHRLLQVTANIYDATTGGYFPTVFRPVFTVDAFGNVFITGYTNVPSVSDAGDPQLAAPYDVSALGTSFGPVTNLSVNVYGVPWIIGAKKGFPNFNEFVQENIVGITRRVQVTRDLAYEQANFPKIRLTGTNQLYMFNLNTSVGLDFWNSYNSNFTDNVTVVWRGVTWMTITNDEAGRAVPILGVPQPMALSYTGTNTFSSWPGTSPWVGGQPNPYSFFTPVFSPYSPVLMNSVYRTGSAGLTPGTLPSGITGPCFVTTNYFGVIGGMTTLFETTTPGFPLPHFGLLATNRLQVFILDFANNSYHVIDYVHLEQMTSQDLNEELFTDSSNGMAPPTGIWNTNFDARTGVPWGIENQINISKGLANVPLEDGIWQSDAEAAILGTTIPAQQASFEAFFYPYGATAHVYDSYGQASASNYMSVVDAPYAPTRFAVGFTILQANDPLVHHLASDLTPSFPPGLLELPVNFNNYITNVIPLAGYNGLNLGSLNLNYQPWGGNPAWNNPFVDPNIYNLAERDPLVSQSDFWNFPAGKSFYVNWLSQPHLDVSWLGQVHRGTPWQTIYLKSSDILSSPAGLNAWMNWTGDPDPTDAMAMAPVQDWHLASLLTSLFNTNDFRSLFSINNPDPAAWRALLNGLTAVTNLSSGQFQLWTITSNSPQAAIIANAIESTRISQPGEWFRDTGDLLAVPQLTEESPYFNLTSTGNFYDAIYEGVVSQLLPLLRADSIGSAQTAGNQRMVQFTGYDGHDYLIQSSADLVDWFNVLTNTPSSGVVNLTNPPTSNPDAQFYRSVLLN